MVSRQHTARDVNAHFVASLPDDLPDPFTHRTLKNRVAVLRDPYGVEPVVKTACARMTRRSSTESLKWTD